MSRAEGIVFALGALGEAAEATALAQRADAVTPSGEDLVRIALVADVPHQLVGRRVEDVVDRSGQFDHAEAGTEVPAGLPHRVDHLGAQFVGQLAELILLELAEIVGCIDRVEQRRLGATSHGDALYTRPTKLSMNALSPEGNGLPGPKRRNRRTARAVRSPGGRR